MQTLVPRDTNPGLDREPVTRSECWGSERRPRPFRQSVRAVGLAVFALACATAPRAANPSLNVSDWRNLQRLDLDRPGLVRTRLPADTLGAARPALEDLRVLDPAGAEVPYAVEIVQPEAGGWRTARATAVTLEAATTVLRVETGTPDAIEAVRLETPAGDFIKALSIEGSEDGTRWQPVVRGAAVFRQPNGVACLTVDLPRRPWPWLRLTLDDQRATPIPVSAVSIRATPPEAAEEPVPVTVAERLELAEETRLVLRLPAANLQLANVRIDARDLIFTRPVEVRCPVLTEDGVQERRLAGGTIHRVAIDPAPATSNLVVALEARCPSPELVVVVRNLDSRPLEIAAVTVTRRPVWIAFEARQAGSYALLTGNRVCAAPRYDLAALIARLRTAPVHPTPWTPLAPNSDYRAPTVLPEVAIEGARLDTAAWRFRKSVRPEQAGVARLTLDADVLACAQVGLADLRLLRGSNQVPYLVEHTGALQPVPATFAVAPDPKAPTLTRWKIGLTHKSLPLRRLVLRSSMPLFERQLVVYEEPVDDRGSKYRRECARLAWKQAPPNPPTPLTIALGEPLVTDTLWIETDNGDNPPITLTSLEAFHPVVRLLFKHEGNDPLHLYYGNAEARPPRYDLGLVAAQLMAAEKTPAALGAQEQLRKAGWFEDAEAPGAGSPFFWGVLIVVVLGLVFILVRLLPARSPSADD